MLTNMTLSAATPANRRSDQARRSSLPWRHRHPVRTKRAEAPPSPTVLIYGSAIKTPAKLPEFSSMRFSNRRQTEGLAIRSFRLSRPFIIRRSTLITSVLIYGSAIKTPTNQPGIINMQFSNRRQAGGLTIASSLPGKIRSGGPLPDHHSSSITRHCSHLAFRAPGATLFAPNRTCQSSPPNGRERPNETCENRIT